MKKKRILLISAALGLILAAAMAVVVLKPELKGSKAENVASATTGIDKRSSSEIATDLDVFVVNLKGPNQGRYLRTTLTLGVKDNHHKEKLKEFAGPIRHAVIMYLSQRSVDELVDADGKDALRAALHKKINEAIGEEMVTNIYFKEFLIQ